MTPENSPETPPPVSWRSLATTFFTVGAIGFGGSMAVLSLLHDYCVERRRWLSSETFAHGAALSQILGAAAVNVAIFVGYTLRGWRGALLAAGAFLAPSFVVVVLLGALYARFSQLPALQAALGGMAPVVVALLVVTAWRLGGTRRASWKFLLPAGIAAALGIFGVPVPLILGGFLLYALGREVGRRWRSS